LLIHASESIALKAVQLWIKKNIWERTEDMPAPWYTGQVDLVKVAISRGFTVCVGALFSQLSKDELRDEWANDPWYSMTYPHIAAAGGHLSVMKLLADHGMSMEDEDEDEVTPLELAVRGNHVEVVDYLLEEHAESRIFMSLVDLPQQSEPFVHPIEYVAYRGTVSMLKKFLASQFSIWCGLPPPENLLYWSLLGDNIEMTKFLLCSVANSSTVINLIHGINHLCKRKMPGSAFDTSEVTDTAEGRAKEEIN
jgi:hypothetical protein